MRGFIIFCIIVHVHASYEIVMPTKNRKKENYLLESLESFKDKHIFLYRHGENFDDFETACIKDTIECNILDVDLDIDDDYLKWRTEENIIVKTILQHFLSRGKDYVIWVEDDVVLIDSLNFVNHIQDHVICLRDGYKYCGTTGFVFSRDFVEDLIETIEIEKDNMPIDWIVDKTVHIKNYFKRRKSVIKHIGLFSSRKDNMKREID